MKNQCNYPPEEIIKPIFGKPNYEFIVLWILNNNEVCTWANLKEVVKHSTLSIYLNRLKNKGYLEKSVFNQYKITPKGKDRYYKLSETSQKKRKLSFPPDVILRRRNYDHWILWMVYNNNFCKWSDFLEPPLSINQSSLSKNLNSLIDKEFVKKEEKEYRITRLGKTEYSNVISLYDLDRQSLLEEEGKRIKEITKKTIRFFREYKIKDNNIKFRFLSNKLKLPYEKVKSTLDKEEEYDKVLLFLSMNHPDRFPEYISPEDFSKKYNINLVKLNFIVLRIVEEKIFPIKFFTLDISGEKFIYFHSNEKIERMLNAIVEDHVTRFSYLRNLYEETPSETSPLTMEKTVSAILTDICGTIFDKGLRESLKNFLPGYINYLAYKIERERKLLDTYDKLEGLIWQEIQQKFYDLIEINYPVKPNEVRNILLEIEKAIQMNPKNHDLLYSKSKILIDTGEYKEGLSVLDKMLIDFPKEEISIQIKRAYILKEMKEVESGLEIIEALIEKYPDNNDLLNYKAFWLQYLNRKGESLELIQKLIESAPQNAAYHDTYGEILMYFADHEHAIEEFQKSIEISSDDWYVYQTYIKLGICYKELENYDLAIEYLQRGIKSTEKSLGDQETKTSWIAIAKLFLAEIEQQEAEF
ncbi:MAG: tetratricopeptide repeat protein [Candidatus Hodarchaeota archaeon]